ncbi:hypothetical protein [Paenibacillus sp. P22]|uniref:hypothetical protein n=1 Tax=Paenibacillus sp. P22 TaxID=483908 RepID=UPI00038F600D|nr:hypothetical protein [Paenibacillus sp. P22]CDN41437.1 hypothetical protein BN871_AH_00110 [Paenibacillus sp. P22]
MVGTISLVTALEQCEKMDLLIQEVTKATDTVYQELKRIYIQELTGSGEFYHDKVQFSDQGNNLLFVVSGVEFNLIRLDGAALCKDLTEGDTDKLLSHGSVRALILDDPRVNTNFAGCIVLTAKHSEGYQTLMRVFVNKSGLIAFQQTVGWINSQIIFRDEKIESLKDQLFHGPIGSRLTNQFDFWHPIENKKFIDHLSELGRNPSKIGFL